jgi:hypothetical protein
VYTASPDQRGHVDRTIQVVVTQPHARANRLVSITPPLGRRQISRNSIVQPRALKLLFGEVRGDKRRGFCERDVQVHFVG